MASLSSDQENNRKSMLETTKQRKECYRELLNRVEDIEEANDLGLQAAKEIGDIIKQVTVIESEHNIMERYQYPEEIFLDTIVLSSASGLLVKCIEKVDVNVATYVASEFADKIIEYVKQDDDFEAGNLLKLVDDADQIIPKVPDYCFLYGTYDLDNLPKPKQKKQRQKQQKQKLEKKEPEKVKNLESEEKGIKEIIKDLYTVLSECYEENHYRPIKYYSYVVDSSSYSNTVENMFYCSFLVRDGKAYISLDSNGIPHIKPMKKKELKQFREGGGGNSQMINAICTSEWETFKKEGYLQKYNRIRKQ